MIMLVSCAVGALAGVASGLLTYGWIHNRRAHDAHTTAWRHAEKMTHGPSA